MNTNELTYGPYTVGDKEYNLAPLTTRRYQAFIRVFTSLPLTLLYTAWSDFQEELQAKVPEEIKERLLKGEITEDDLTDITLTDSDMTELGAAITQMVVQADDQDVLVGLLAIALDIGVEEAAGIHYKVMLEAVSDFFIDNPSLLPDTVRFLTGMANPMKRSLQTKATPETGPPAKPSSISTPSPPKPEGSAEGENQMGKSKMEVVFP